MTYFAEIVPTSEVWTRCRGSVPASVRNEDLPAGLLEMLARENESEETGLVRCLELLAGVRGLAAERGR